MRKAILLAAIFALFFIQWVLMPSKLECTGDGPSHADSVWFYGHSLKSFLRVPWTNPFFFSGASFSVFYFSLLYAAAGMLSAVLNYILALKIIIILSYALSVYSMRLLAKEHGLDEKESLLAGLLYAFSNWIVFTTFFRGAYLDVIAYPFLPFAFLYIKRGLDRELVPFIASTFLLAVSFQNSLYFLLPALVFYALVNRAKLSHMICWAASLILLLAFFAVPFASLKGETLIRTEFSSPSPRIPVNLVIPQWGWFYPEYEKYVPHFVELDSVYAGALHVALALLGIFYFWRRFPAMALILLYSLGFLIGVFPSLLLVARILFLMNVPLAIFIPLGVRKVLEMGHGKKAAILAFAVLLNAAGIAVLARVYLTRAKFMAVGDARWVYLPAALILAGGFAILLLLRAKGWKQKYVVVAIVALLLLEALPNAVNPTMAFPTPTQIDPCSYRSVVGEHEFVANSFCAMPCGNVYSYRAGLIGPARLTAEYMRMSESSSLCPGELAALGVRYCFSKGELTEMEPAPFVNSTSRYAIERDEPDHLAIRFDSAGKAKVRLGYFSFYKAFAGGRPISLEQSREGFIEFDNPAGTVDIKVVPPGSFAYSYLVSALAGLGLVWFLLKKREKLLALSCLPILVHVLLRLFWMLD